MVADGPGAQLQPLLAEASPEQLEKLVGQRLLSLICTIAGGDRPPVPSVLADVIDLDQTIAEPTTRNVLVSLLSANKRTEFYSRTGSTPETEAFTASMVREGLAFFGVATTRSSRRRTVPAAAEAKPTYGLFPHQRQAATKVRSRLRGGAVVLHLPTGVGKTRTAMSIVADHFRAHEPTVVVWLAAGEELLEQAATEFERTWSHLGDRALPVVRCWGDADLDEAAITDGLVVLGLQKAAAALRCDDDALTPLGPRARFVVFDEAHQAIAPTFRRVTDRLTVSPQSRLLGLSATPGRTWADIEKDNELSNYFGQEKVTLELPGYDNPIVGLTEQGYLAHPRFSSLLTEPGTQMSEADLAELAEGVDVPAQRLEELSTDEQWNLKIVEAVRELACRHNRILIFAASVAHCRLLASLLTATGIPADHVTGQSLPEHRRRAIDRFKSPYGSATRALVNYGVLTTGFDAPQASAAVIARPTTSLVLYSQMVGRVLRGPLAGGTPECEVVTVVDTTLPGFGDIAEAFTNWDDVWRTE